MHGLTLQGASYSLQHGLPVAEFRLPEEAHGGIPEAILAIQEPAPVGRKWQQDPNRNAKRASQMRSGVIDGDHQVHGGDLCGEDIEV